MTIGETLCCLFGHAIGMADVELFKEMANRTPEVKMECPRCGKEWGVP